MADRTSQPADGVGVHSAYSTATFLWNGVAPTKNQIGGATVTAKGTPVPGADGTYQRMNNVDGAMSWTGVTAPATAYTLVALIVFPQASFGPGILIAVPGAFRIEPYTTGGGAYIPLTQSGVAAASNIFLDSAPMDSEMWTYVARYTGTQLVQYLKRGDGTTLTTLTETIGYSGAGSNQVDIGDQFNNPGHGLYAAMIVPSDVGNTEALALRDNGWRMFAETGGGGGSTGALKRKLLLGVG
jgi:hypothetical protein